MLTTQVSDGLGVMAAWCPPRMALGVVGIGHQQWLSWKQHPWERSRTALNILCHSTRAGGRGDLPPSRGTETAPWAPAFSITLPKLQLLFPAWSCLTVLGHTCSQVFNRLLGRVRDAPGAVCRVRGVTCRGPAHLPLRREMPAGEVRGQSGWLGLIYYQSFRKQNKKSQKTPKPLVSN